MNRNPFCKNDYGCSFICFLSLFVLVQLLFGFNYLNIVIMNDSGLTNILIENSIENGFEYVEKEDKFVPEVTDKAYY